MDQERLAYLNRVTAAISVSQFTPTSVPSLAAWYPGEDEVSL